MTGYNVLKSSMVCNLALLSIPEVSWYFIDIDVVVATTRIQDALPNFVYSSLVVLYKDTAT